ncbi:hypothetical protein LCGC14_1278980 [marine sediment metagenome]|uniref:Uncharacterized protein n=1 Tax=marine sediment metagenome TaxID=412755 RepID=A0A0F9KVR0_9ZZZZ
MSKRIRPKVRGKKEVFDEWEHMDIDRNEQKAGLKRRARRWKEIQREVKLQKVLEKKAINNADKMKLPPKTRQPTPLEEAWLRCDYVLFHMLTRSAYQTLEWIRINDVEGYKYIYKIVMSPNMMNNISYYVDYFAEGGTVDKLIPKNIIMGKYMKYRGYKPIIKVKRKGEEEYDV